MYCHNVINCKSCANNDVGLLSKNTRISWANDPDKYKLYRSYKSTNNLDNNCFNETSSHYSSIHRARSFHCNSNFRTDQEYFSARYSYLNGLSSSGINLSKPKEINEIKCCENKKKICEYSDKVITDDKFSNLVSITRYMVDIPLCGRSCTRCVLTECPVKSVVFAYGV